MMGAQLGKTEGLILNTIGYYMHYEPSPMLAIGELAPTIAICPPGKCFFNIVFPLLRLLSLTFPRNTGVSRNIGLKRYSTMEEWCVPCPVCGELQPLQWKHIIFDANNLDETEAGGGKSQ